MPQATKQEQLRVLLRPLSEQFTSQVASTIMSFVQRSVRDEVELVLGRALPVAEASPSPVLLPKAPPPKRAAAKAKAPTIKCSKQRCDGVWYRPSGSETKLCYKHFLEAGGKPPPGKKAKKK